MGSSLFRKLFALQLLAGLALFLVALGSMRLESAQSFSDYLDQQRRELLRRDAEGVAAAYRQSHDLGAAAAALPQAPGSGWRPPGGAPPGLGPPGAPPPGTPPPGAAPPATAGFPPDPPKWLLDTHDQVVGGSRQPLPPQEMLREPVAADGVIVGYVVQPRQGGRNTAAEQDFAQRQARGLRLSFGIAVVVAALIAALISSLILRPLRRLSEGAAALARRDFRLRLPADSADELGRLARDFNRLGEALERYDAQQKQWLADVAHELRTPLAVLRGELEAILDGVRSPDAAAIRSLHQEVQRLAALVDDLHLLSLAESGGLHIERSAVDAAALLDEAAARFQARLNAGRFSLERSVQPGLPAFSADQQRLSQVLANLLENVLRHARAPGIVSISAGRAPEGVRIAVADSGPGVPEASLSRLFDRLYRVDQARSRQAGGSGLGLAICRSIVEAHGGRISARHSTRGGLEVELILPTGAAP